MATTLGKINQSKTHTTVALLSDAAISALAENYEKNNARMEADENFEQINLLDDAISDGSADAVIVDGVRQIVEEDDVSSGLALEAVRICIRHLSNVNGFKARQKTSMESASFEYKKKIALESASEFLRNVWEGIKRAISYVWEKIKAFFGFKKKAGVSAIKTLEDNSDKLKEAERAYKKSRAEMWQKLMNGGNSVLHGGDSGNGSTISKLVEIDGNQKDLEEKEVERKIVVDSEVSEIRRTVDRTLEKNGAELPSSKIISLKEEWEGVIVEKTSDKDNCLREIHEAEGKIKKLREELAKNEVGGSTRFIIPASLPLDEVVESVISLTKLVSSLQGPVLGKHNKHKELLEELQKMLAYRGAPGFFASDDEIVKFMQENGDALDFTEKSMLSLFKYSELESYRVDFIPAMTTQPAFAPKSISDAKSLWDCTDALSTNFTLKKIPDHLPFTGSWVLNPESLENITKLQSKLEACLEEFDQAKGETQTELKNELSKGRDWSETDKVVFFLMGPIDKEHREKFPAFLDGVGLDEKDDLVKSGRQRGWLLRGMTKGTTVYARLLVMLYNFVGLCHDEVRDVLMMNSDIIRLKTKLVKILAEIHDAGLELANQLD